MITLSKLVVLAALTLMVAEGVRTWPTPFDEEVDPVAEVIHAYESGVIQQKSFDNIMKAMGQP